MLRLNRSKKDVKHIGIEIIIAATNDFLCPVLALCKLLILDSQPNNAPLFSLADGATFTHNPVIEILC